MKHVRAVLAVILAALPFLGRAEDPQPAAPAAAEAAPAPVQPAPEPPKPPPPSKVTFDVSGWFSLDAFSNSGPMNAADFPRWALTKDLSSSTATKIDDSQVGLSVRQTRFRSNIGIPDQLAGATLKGFVEADFSGAPGSDVSAWLPRLRHAYATATWKELANLTVLVGQTWGVAPGPYAPASITHIVVPRLGGAGFLFRRAPQVRLSGDLPVAPDAGVNLTYTAALVEPDIAAGEKSGMPNIEGRLAGQFKSGGKQMVDLGVFGHFGKEKYTTYELTGTGPTDTAVASGTKTAVLKDVDAQAIGVDLKLDIPYVSILAQFYTGKNLDAYYTTAPGVATKTATDTTDTACGMTAGGYCSGAGQVTRKPNKVVTAVSEVEVKGYMAQAVITPVKGLAIIAGYGVEEPDKDTLPALAAPTASAGTERYIKNAQLSFGLHYNLLPRWKIGVEFTQYSTDYEYKPKGALAADPVQSKTFTSSQLELGSLFNF